MKKNKILNILAYILFAMQLAAETVLLIGILQLDMLPAKFLIPVIALLAIGLLVTGLLIFWPLQKDKSGKGRRFVRLLASLSQGKRRGRRKNAPSLHRTIPPPPYGGPPPFTREAA